MKATKRVAESRKRRYLQLRREGMSQAQASRVAQIGRTTSWKLDKLLDTEGPSAGTDQPEEPAPPRHDVDEDRRKDLDEARSVIPENLLEALNAPDEPADTEKPGTGLPEGLPAIAGDPEEPSRGFGQRQIPGGHPAGARKTYVPGRDRSFARRLSPDESTLGPDRDLVAGTARPVDLQAAPRRPAKPPVDPRASHQRHARRRRRGPRQGPMPPDIIIVGR